MVATSRTNTKRTTVGPVSDYYYSLVQRLQANGMRWTSTPRAIGLAGVDGALSCSTVATNFAVAAAKVSTGRVLLVAAHPHKFPARRADKVGGLLDVLVEGRNVFDCLMETPVANLSLMLVGNSGEEPAFNADAVDELLDSLKHVFQLVVFDLPAANERSNRFFSLAASLDGMLLVLDDGRVREDVAQRSVGRLKAIEANILGVVLNKRQDGGV